MIFCNTNIKFGVQLEWQDEAVNEKGIIASIKNEIYPTRRKFQILNEELKNRNNKEKSNLELGTVLMTVTPKYFRLT